MKGMNVQAWPPLPSHTQPLMSTPQIGQTPSQGGGHVTSFAAAAAAMPPTRQEAPEIGEGATESHTSASLWAGTEDTKVCAALFPTNKLHSAVQRAPIHICPILTVK